MAATKKGETVTMKLHVATGEDASGNLIWADRSIQYINPELSDENFCSVAGGLAQLVADTLGSVYKNTVEEFEID